MNPVSIGLRGFFMFKGNNKGRNKGEIVNLKDVRFSEA